MKIRKTNYDSYRLLFLLVSMLWMMSVNALTGVNPTGVNVRTHGPTTVFLTFQGTAGQTTTEAFWCGDITVPANTVTTFNPCVPNTLFGFLPSSLDRARQSGTGGAVNTTDIMSIPASVSRRAFQAAKAGAKSSFFYVRKFSSGGVDQYVAVTCRLGGGGARTPLSLLHVNTSFKTAQGDVPVTLLAQGEKIQGLGATVYYNGSGRIKGRWEVVMPGDPEPSANDLLSEATLPVEQRGLQRRYTLLERFDIFLPPTGKTYIAGPKNIPVNLKGPYKILFRVEATADKEGDSNTTTGVVNSGGVAGFPMPVLRYYVANKKDVIKARSEFIKGKLTLMLPLDNSKVTRQSLPDFTWVDVNQATLYRLEVAGSNEMVLQAIVKPGVSSYSIPPLVTNRIGEKLRWRVIAIGKDGTELASSHWRHFTVE